jgi:hypothetical protein
MGEIRQEQKQNNPVANETERLLPIRVSPTEVRYMTEEELRSSLSDEDVQRALDLAGIWSGLNITEEELFRRLNEIRYGPEPTTGPE